jgi:hypothetical protein
MADRPRLNDAALATIRLPSSNGETMIAISRAILSGHYSDEEFNEDFFIAFIGIDDEYDHIILDGYGEFNTASPRFMLSGNRFRDFLKLTVGRNKPHGPVNTEIHQAEIQELYKSQHDLFLESLDQFKAYFKSEL